MSLFNNVQLLGRAANTPQFRILSDGTPQVRFRIYLSSKRADPDSDVPPESFTVVGWGSVARKMAARIRRGKQILVRGELRNRRFTSEGVVHLRTEIHARQFFVHGHSEGKIDQPESLPDQRTPAA